MTDPVRTIADRVRTRVRREGVDLATDRELAARYVREEVRRYSERALGGSHAACSRDEARHRARGRRGAHRVRAAAAVPRRSRRSRRCGSTRPTASSSRATASPSGRPCVLTDARGARPRRADAAVTRASRRPLVALRRRVAARRLAPARRDPRHHAPALGREHPQVPAAACATSSELVRARRLHARRRPSSCARACSPGRNILVSGATQSGKTTHARRAASRRARPTDRVVTVEETFELAARRARPGRAAVPAAEPRGHGRDHAAPAHQGGPADAPRPARGRRGARGRGARPADRAEHAGCPACARSTPTRARDALAKLCHAAAARRAQHRLGVRRADGGGLHRPRRAPRNRPRRPAARLSRSSRRAARRRMPRSTPTPCSPVAAATSCRPAPARLVSRSSPAAGLDPAWCRAERPDEPHPRRCLGLGVLLVGLAVALARAPARRWRGLVVGTPRHPRRARSRRARRRTAGGGRGGVRHPRRRLSVRSRRRCSRSPCSPPSPRCSAGARPTRGARPGVTRDGRRTGPVARRGRSPRGVAFAPACRFPRASPSLAELGPASTRRGVRGVRRALERGAATSCSPSTQLKATLADPVADRGCSRPCRWPGR